MAASDSNEEEVESPLLQDIQKHLPAIAELAMKLASDLSDTYEEEPSHLGALLPAATAVIAAKLLIASAFSDEKCDDILTSLIFSLRIKKYPLTCPSSTHSN